MNIKDIRLKTFEKEIAELHIPFIFIDEPDSFDALKVVAGEYGLLKEYSSEIYSLCTDNELLKNKDIFQRISQLVEKTILKSGSQICTFEYSRDASLFKMAEEQHKVYEELSPFFDLIFEIHQFDPSFRSGISLDRYGALNDYVGPINKHLCINCCHPYTDEGKKLNEWEPEILYFYFLKINEIMNKYDFYLSNNTLQPDYSEFM